MCNNHRRTGRVSFRGAEVSCPNIFSIVCTKIEWFCPNITRFFCPRMAIWKILGGGGAAAPLSPMGRTAMVILHWASKETYNFLEWCPLKSTASKWMIFGLMLATVLLITHVKKQRNRMCQKWDKCLQITTSPISKSQNLLPFHRADFRTLQ